MLTKYSIALAVTLATSSLLSAQRGGERNQEVQPPRAQPPILPTPIGLQPQYSGFTGINYGVYPNQPYTSTLNNGRGGGHGGGHGGNYGFGLPVYPAYYTTGGGTYPEPAPPNQNQTDAVTSNLLGEKIQNLTAEIQAMKAERFAPQPAPAEAAPPAPPAQPITLVLRDGRKFQVQSFAVMNGVFWDFSQPTSRRIPLSSIDVASSEKATEQSGAEFPDLGSQRPAQ